jgi:hypothetical protein
MNKQQEQVPPTEVDLHAEFEQRLIDMTTAGCEQPVHQSFSSMLIDWIKRTFTRRTK